MQGLVEVQVVVAIHSRDLKVSAVSLVEMDHSTSHRRVGPVVLRRLIQRNYSRHSLVEEVDVVVIVVHERVPIYKCMSV